jgi:two-component system sensor histidine kinase KdpD
MVCLSSKGPNSEKLLRYASRLAGRLNRNWYAVYVQTASERPPAIDGNMQKIISNTLSLAKQLGAMAFTYRGEDVVKTVLEFAKEYRVGHIIVGSSDKKLSFWRRIFGKPKPVNQLIRESKNHTIVVVDTSEPDEEIQQLKQSTQRRTFVPVSEFLSEARILFWNQPVTKENALQQLAIACSKEIRGITADEIHAAVMEREKHGTTFLNEGIALPHARIEGLERPILAAAISEEGVNDSAAGTIARVVFYVLTPAASPEVQVSILGALSKLAIERLAFSRLIHAESKEAVISILKGFTI